MDRTSDRTARRIHVVGRVQGVYFRAAARSEAESLGLAGWAHNEPDRSVKILVEGDPESIAEFIAWCKHGPPDARVERIEIAEVDITGLDGFHIS